MTAYDHTIAALDGTPDALSPQKGHVGLFVNVASKCGLTPQYEGLQRLHDTYSGRGFTVLGFPCNQFGGQEPGTAEQIQEFCSLNYGVTFPLFEKIEVNGDDRHPLYEELTAAADGEGHTGDIRWNFEKFLVGPEGQVLARFSPMVTPDDPDLVAAIEEALAH
ncbi:MAG TPA: glutathione peroxidase [Acidimicrobiales bacterium]|nr:glutathione peroxidase [Acidimicrobiales bacterium]